MHERYDHLVIGSGIAGLVHALSLAKSGSIALVTKRQLRDATTARAQGGIAVAISQEDSWNHHLQDTIKAGDGLCNETVARMIIRDGPSCLQRLIEWGVQFTHNETGAFDLTQEAGHSQRRILHVRDMTGKAVEDALIAAIQNHPNIRLLEHHIAVDLITTHKLRLDMSTPNRCLGAYVLDIASGNIITLAATTTLVATGGAGKVYLYTTNPDIASGDGMAMAFRAGCRVANLEFVQFHPTCLFHPHAKSFLISETVRGEGGILRTIDGDPFMKRYDARVDLATRDIVARAIDNELKKSGADYVLLDISHQSRAFLENRFPALLEKCLQFGIDMRTDPIPVVPAAHSFCGGVVTDHDGCTDIAGLFAAGEVACTGLHGANRLASNALLEGLVMASRSAVQAEHFRMRTTPLSSSLPPWNATMATNSDEEVVISQNWDEVRRLMWNYVGIVRSNKRLARAKKRIDILRDEIREYYWNFTITNNLLELRNIALVADLVIQSALTRRESRGLHYTIDYPEKNDALKKDTILVPAISTST